MATRSTIAMQNVDGTVTSIYCHWDGYIGHNGNILYQFYRKDSKVRKLIRLGNLSSLQIEIGTKHDFDACPANECNAYGRDRGEKLQGFKRYASWSELLANDGEEYNYLYVPDEGWTVNCYSGTYKLADALKDDFKETA